MLHVWCVRNQRYTQDSVFWLAQNDVTMIWKSHLLTDITSFQMDCQFVNSVGRTPCLPTCLYSWSLVCSCRRYEMGSVPIGRHAGHSTTHPVSPILSTLGAAMSQRRHHYQLMTIIIIIIFIIIIINIILKIYYYYYY